ncbi:zinc finger CCCH domain-containing protein 15 isoform X2 [Eutrema salsugineum]|uniref:zinc finger CCCH domain-containing protein 15 isoform X2 n=1 Tax=Eutrema salsugineum TaxID=72664 RepID=UPI000CED0F24|nr:zinc finger CCCH domain-containing protein 15 isoform X2 [Eutrema salsugineum]
MFIEIRISNYHLLEEISYTNRTAGISPRTMENEIAPYTYSGSSAGVVGIMKPQGEPSGVGVAPPSLLCDQLYKSSRNVMQQRQDMVNREALCYTRLHEASLEAEVLRLENAQLRSMNRHLKTELDQLIRSSIQNRLNHDRVPLRMLSNLSIGGNHDANGAENQNRAPIRDEVSEESPTSVIENEDVNRSSLPKSISVRSSGYSKSSQGGGAAQCGKSRGTLPKPGTCGQQLTTTQKVYVRGGKKEEEEEIEVEVYNQGMTKTELCNKWQETGTCPYGDHCQFAHGIKELRPVIRHPRYKTEVCRMVLAGDACPYGHRCHFRHSLSEQEKLMAAGFKPKSSFKVLK